MSRLGTIRPALQRDIVAALVLGIQSVPAGLANGLLAGVNPLAGLYAYLVGPAAGALVTSSAFMAIQGTGAMAVVIADIPEVHSAVDPAEALFTLAVVTGAIMLAVGLLRLGSIMRFVSNAVMVGFINAVGVNIVLGQLADLTGYHGRWAQSHRTRRRHGPEPSADPPAVALRRPRHHRAHRAHRTHPPGRHGPGHRGRRRVGPPRRARLARCRDDR